MNDLSLLDGGGQPRQELITRVHENAGIDWQLEARAWLYRYLESHEWLGPDLVKAGCPEPPNDRRSMGALIQRAKRSGWIVRDGTAVRENGTEGPKYRSLIWGAA